MARSRHARPSGSSMRVEGGRARFARGRGSSSVVPSLLAGFAIVYAVSIGLFALTHYDGPRPGAGRVVRDFHAYLGLGPNQARAAIVPVAVAPKPRPAPSPPPPVVRRPTSPLDAVAAVLKDVGREAPALKQMARGPAFDDVRFDLLNRLIDARERLGGILDAEPSNDRANDLWDRLQYLQAALRRL